MTTRLLSKSIGCCKKFPGRNALTTPESIAHWVNELISEISKRLERDVKENNRRARQITLHFTQTVNDKDISNSRTLSLNCYNQSKIIQSCLDVLKKNCVKSDGTYDIKYLGFSVGNFEPNSKTGKISNFLENMRSFKLQKNMPKKKLNEEGSADTSKLNIFKNDQLSNIVRGNIEQQSELFLEKKLFNEDAVSRFEEKNSISDGDNTSIYSAETDDLNEDIKSLIFYEDIYPENVASEPIFTKPLKDSNYLRNKCRTNETILKNSCHTDLFIEGASSSFFSKYFQNYNIDDNYESSPVERNFDTSKILKQEYSDEIKCTSIKITENDTEEENIKSQIEFQEQEIRKLSGSEPCPECGKNILKSEIESHMDYHFALDIVKKEAHLYKSAQTSIPKQLSSIDRPLNNQSKPVTRKRTADMKPIHTYMQTDELNEENSELCLECNKRIKLDDIINHMDYHTAKKLHLEINAKSSFVPNSNNVEKINAKGKKKIVKHTSNITSFLNRSSI